MVNESFSLPCIDPNSVISHNTTTHGQLHMVYDFHVLIKGIYYLYKHAIQLAG